MIFGSEDVRGTLIALVLNALQELVVSDETEVAADRKAVILAKLQDLRRRIAWGRVAKVLVTSAVSMSPDIGGLIEALTPQPPSPAADEGPQPVDGPQSMAGFRADFEVLMGGDPGLTKVVVLVDDLDRCLPPAVVSTLEAIKLFLSVKKRAFVLAADEELIRASIDAHLGGLGRGEFAARYTEKIVQLPISLPVLSQQDAEAYVAFGEDLDAVRVKGAGPGHRHGTAIGGELHPHHRVRPLTVVPAGRLATEVIDIPVVDRRDLPASKV
ncbi:P-loop NTPase fold protein [Lapillicoccus sp.]|uniref:KAP family P-loop NTPase fold protein n=1 Tax=Lapillicoccus sp. TaxID=1909287 RepID=UPI0025E4A9D8|nr:P-loop NTPase fold protein [Lapillicoccus sp.]